MNGKQNILKSVCSTPPPRLPKTEEELELTLTLLGNRKQCELSAQARQKLEKLIGTYPTAKEASLWKRTLRRVYKESRQVTDIKEQL